ncbi:YraN family protein [Petroclostridium sp. X23]|uniref:YraN family protein n=1 Tax=Petroclostridium sp. X23 TaxID=3045146 RepID=UPI0024ACC242|nr:YraN family protein [Petroclostridium sp. X23]WHH59432.1 YraN family protein [Petroclostridium sp. X23]
MTVYKKQIGALGEQEAANYLIKNHYTIIDKNFRCRLGEIDIIAREGEYIVFIEVKTRKDCRFGIPAEAVDYYKRNKIIQIAQYYLMQKRMHGRNIRFDVVEVIGCVTGHKPDIKSVRVIKNAFQA